MLLNVSRLMFSHDETGVMGFEEVKCLSHHITSRVHAINITSLSMLTLVSWLRSCSSALSTEKLLLFFPRYMLH